MFGLNNFTFCCKECGSLDIIKTQSHSYVRIECRNCNNKEDIETVFRVSMFD